MPRHDRQRPVAKTSGDWPSDSTLRCMMDREPLLLVQLALIFGDRLACEIVCDLMMKVKR